MTHVVVVTPDTDVLTVLDDYLRKNGHVVLSVRDAQHALPALEVGRYQAVVIIHAPTATDGGFDLLRRAVSSNGKHLARHTYIILTADEAVISSERLAKVAHLKAKVLELPFGLEEVAAAIEDADSDQLSPARSVPAIHALSPQPYVPPMGG